MRNLFFLTTSSRIQVSRRTTKPWTGVVGSGAVREGGHRMYSLVHSHVIAANGPGLRAFCSQKLSILGSGQLEAGLLRALTVVSLVGVVPLIAPASPAPSGAFACLLCGRSDPVFQERAPGCQLLPAGGTIRHPDWSALSPHHTFKHLRSYYYGFRIL